MQRYLLGIGAINVDLMGRSTERMIAADSNPGSVSVSVGGVTHNICENVAKMGIPIKLISAIGDDLNGQLIRSHCQTNNIDISHSLFLSGHTSSTYLSLHEPDGEMVLALSDMHILQLLSIEHLKAHSAVIEQASAIVMDCGLPQAILDYVATLYGKKIPIFVDPVSTTYVNKLTGDLSGYHTIKPNLIEAQILADMTISTEQDLNHACSLILSRGVRQVVVSLGRDGVYFADCSGLRRHARTSPLETVVNATGAGDAMVAGLIYSYLNAFPTDRALSFSMAASLAALSSRETIRPDLSVPLIGEFQRQFPLL